MIETTPFRQPGFWRRLSRLDPAGVFAWVALPVGALLVVLTPPFQVPDEPNHLARAFQVSDGHPIAQRTADSVGGLLPRSLGQVAAAVMGKVPFNPDVKQDLDAWARAFEIPLRPDDRVETAFPNTALSGPVAYLPQAVGVGIGRGIGVSALMVLYLGRIASMLLCVAITTLAIRWLAIRPWTSVLLSLLPMTLFVRSSVPTDRPPLPRTMLALAICHWPIRTATGDSNVAPSRSESVDRTRRGLLFSTAALLALGKPPYGAAAFLALATPPRLIGGVKRYLSMSLVLTVVFLVAQGGWALAMSGKTAVMAPGADPATQLAYVSDHPGDAAAFLARDLARSAPALAHQAVGVLGWLDAPVPGVIAALLGLIVLLVALGEPGPPSGCAGYRWLGAAIGAFGALARHAMNYVWWTPPGAPRVEGIQGRHFLPLIPFLFLAMNLPARIAGPLARLRPGLVIAFIVIGATTTLLTVLERYYLDI